MALRDHARQQIDGFFEATQRTLGCYKHSTFSYFAVKHGNDFHLCQGRLRLQWTPTIVKSVAFESPNVRAGICKLDDLNPTPRGFAEALLSGVLRTPQGELLFPPEKDGSYFMYLDLFKSGLAGVQPIGKRQLQLIVRGERHYQTVETRELDWELRAARPPFNGLKELCSECLVGPIDASNLQVEMLAANVASLAPDSSICGTNAKLRILLANGLERTEASLGYRITERGGIVSKRGSVSGNELSWTASNGAQCGEATMDVPSGTVLHCIVTFAGEVQHQELLADPSTSQNPVRAVYQVFDHDVSALAKHLDASYGKDRKRDARKFEAGVARLLWLLGFNVTHLGGTPNTSDAPDLIASTPQGHFAVIECTTGVLKEDHKLSLLVNHAEGVRKSLAASGHENRRVLAIIVTSKSREEVKADLEQAQKLEVFVVTQETIAGMLKRSLAYPNADELYTEAEESLRPRCDLSGLSVTNTESHIAPWE